MTRAARLAARVAALEETVVELVARVQTLELVVRPTTRLDSGLRPHRNGDDDMPSGAS